jgi:hypothetical protein
MTTTENKCASTREPEVKKIFIFDDGSLSYELLQSELRQNELIKVSHIRKSLVDILSYRVKPNM